MKNHTCSLDTTALERPSPSLLTYYFLSGLLSGPACVFVIPALIIRYNTLRYRFEDSGLRMQLGLFFRKEVVVAFRRIQDIHVSRNLVQRWLGIASVSVQTASGNAMPEIVLEGVTNPDEVRDWLYERMRGAKGYSNSQAAASARESTSLRADDVNNEPNETTELLRGIRDNLALLVAKSRKSDSES